MAVGMLAQIPGMTQDTYDSVMQHLDWDEKELPKGFVSHYAGASADGWVVFDVWESEEDFRRFHQERLAPAITAATGGRETEIQPTFVQIHNQDHARARVAG